MLNFFNSKNFKFCIFLYISYCPNHFTGSCLRFLHLVQCLSINFPLLLYLYLRDQLIDPRTSAQCAQCVPAQCSSPVFPVQCFQPSVSSSAQWTCSQPNERFYISMWTRFPVDILHFSVWTTTKMIPLSAVPFLLSLGRF